MSNRRGNYGFDALGAFAGLIVGAVVLLTLTGVSFAAGALPAAVSFLLVGVYTLASAISYAYTTRRGRFRVWADELDLQGGEHVLDLGSGNGVVLTRAALRLPDGRVVGVASAAAAPANAAAEGVADRSGFVSADLRELPFDDEVFDVVVSSQALRELGSAECRAQAVREAYRVAKLGGRLLIADVRHSVDYESVLRGLGAADVRRRDLGWRYWYGGPWSATWMVEAYKRSAQPVR
ncbi:class I SAM-dependent methyltransferase [Nonomuraea longicatena]|uniref:class I SAM-dependent methyltransferase n=1 Tax=Nonomuraea longicatena TaxID=83682 RepID=UPI0031DEEC79